MHKKREEIIREKQFSAPFHHINVTPSPLPSLQDYCRARTFTAVWIAWKSLAPSKAAVSSALQCLVNKATCSLHHHFLFSGLSNHSQVIPPQWRPNLMHLFTSTPLLPSAPTSRDGTTFHCGHISPYWTSAESAHLPGIFHTTTLTVLIPRPSCMRNSHL